MFKRNCLPFVTLSRIVQKDIREIAKGKIVSLLEVVSARKPSVFVYIVVNRGK